MASSYSTTTTYTGAPTARAHPIHGILSAYPLALFTAALIADIAYTNSANMQWANFAVWLIAGGCAMGVLAAIAGIVDALTQRRSQRPGGPGRATNKTAGATFHTLATGLMLVLGIVNGFVHSRDGWTSVVPTGLILSVIVSVLALVTSWQGYTMLAREAR
jgi:uncharacterized membrane protein